MTTTPAAWSCAEHAHAVVVALTTGPRLLGRIVLSPHSVEVVIASRHSPHVSCAAALSSFLLHRSGHCPDCSALRVACHKVQMNKNIAGHTNVGRKNEPGQPHAHRTPRHARDTRDTVSPRVTSALVRPTCTTLRHEIGPWPTVSFEAHTLLPARHRERARPPHSRLTLRLTSRPCCPCRTCRSSPG